MSIEFEALREPTKDTLDEWLSTPRMARCGQYFTPSKPMWRPDTSDNKSVNWQAAILCVPYDWKSWLHAALACRMTEVSQGTLSIVCSSLSRAAHAGFDPLNVDHLIDIRELLSVSEFANVSGFMEFWQANDSLELRPSHILVDAYKNMPRKTGVRHEPILSLDPEKGPFTQAEQNALYQWMHEQFCHKNLDPERYLYLRLMMLYGQRGVQFRMMVFDDFIPSKDGYMIRIHWAKQKDDEVAGFRAKSEIFNLDEDLYQTVQAYKAIVLARLKQEYPTRADWDKAIKNVPLFRRKLPYKNDFSNNMLTPVLVDDPNQAVLEEKPHLRFHAVHMSVRNWLSQMENMPGFPVSPRTHQPLKITRAHRFKYTLGTDLANAGLDEWSISRALMHSDSRTVRKYQAVSAELMSLVDDKMSDHLSLVVNAFTGVIVPDRSYAKNGDREDRQIEDLAVCGADARCHLDTPFSCYACSKFQPLLDADHRAALGRMERRRAKLIATDKTTAVIWDRAILACRKVILDCETMCSSSNAAGGLSHEQDC